MAAEKQQGFEIDGVFYEHPFTTWDLDDAEALYDRTGLIIEDWLTADDPSLAPEEAKELDAKFRNPRLVRTLAAIAYWKAHKDVPLDDIVKMVGPLLYADVFEGLAGEDDALPPESTTEREPSSLKSSVEPSENSASDSRKSSDAPVVPLAPTTTTESDTSSISPPASLVS